MSMLTFTPDEAIKIVIVVVIVVRGWVVLKDSVREDVRKGSIRSPGEVISPCKFRTEL